jgi:hypothetical protein
VKGYGKYGRKWEKEMKNTEENSEKIGKIQTKIAYFSHLFAIFLCIFHIISLFN